MEWFGKEKSQNRTEFDSEVVLHTEKRSKNNKSMLLFKFRKNSIHKIAVDCQYIVIAKDDNKIYFKESDKNRGFKINDYCMNTKSFKVDLSKFTIPEECFGEYNLEFDSKLGLHYICLSRKLEKTLNWEGK